jgi:hypothetical protein
LGASVSLELLFDPVYLLLVEREQHDRKQDPETPHIDERR